MSQQQMVSVDQIDAALKRYYDLMGEEYAGQFSEYCEENGFEDLAEEMATDYTDCMLVDFDEDIPFRAEPDDKTEAIFKLLKKIYLNPECDFKAENNEYKPLKLSVEDFDIKKQEIKKVKEVHCSQLETIFNGEMKDDKNITKMLAISSKLNAPYLLYLADMFSRDRITADPDKNLQPSDWANSNKHCVLLGKTISSKAKDCAQHAVTSFFHRICPKLMLNSTSKICDSLEATARYISTEVDFVCNMAQSDQISCPFQVDACIAYNKVKYVEVMENPHNDDDDEYDDDIDSDDDDKHDDDDVFIDCFGNIKQRLKAEKLLHEIASIDDDEKVSRSVRAYKVQFDKFKQNQIRKKYVGKEFNEYPRNHRFCSLIDRRKPKNKNNNNGIVKKDEIYFFEPPSNCNTMPNEKQQVVPLWYFDSSKTSIIPQKGYTKSLNSKDPTTSHNQDPTKQNINSGFPAKGALLILSFHVISDNEIRAYLYLNGQITRFFPEDIVVLLPRFFQDTAKNKEFVKSETAKDMVEGMQQKLRDLKFEAFYNEYKYKNNKKK